MTGDIVWTTDINTDPFVQSTNRMRSEAKRTRDEVQKSFQDMFFANSNQVAQRESAQRAQAALVGASSNNFFAASASMATQDQIEKEQRLAMAQRVRFEAEAHHDQQRIAMRARMDAAYEQQIAQEQRLAQQKAQQAAIDARIDRRVSMAVENTQRQRAIGLIIDQTQAEERLLNQQLKTSRSDTMRNYRDQLSFGGMASTAGAMRASMFTQQIAYGIEDAMSQYGTMGLAGAIRGGSNNLSAALAILNPTYAILGALASTTLLVGASFLTMGRDAKKSSEETKQAVDEISEAERKLAERIQYSNKYFEDRRRIQESIKTSGGIQSEMGRLETERAQLESEIAIRKRMRQELMAKHGVPLDQADMTEAETLQARRQMGANAIVLKTKELRDQFSKLDAELSFAESKFQSTGQSLVDFDQKLTEVTNKEQQRDIFMSDVKRLKEWGDMRMDAIRDIQRNSQALIQSVRTPYEKYREEIKRIEQLRRQNPFLISEEVVRKASRNAWEIMQQEMSRGATIPVYFRRAVDARSAEALSPYFDAISKSAYGINGVPANYAKQGSLTPQAKPFTGAEFKAFGEMIQSSPGVNATSDKLVRALEKLSGVVDKSVRQEEQLINAGQKQQPQLNIVTF